MFKALLSAALLLSFQLSAAASKGIEDEQANVSPLLPGMKVDSVCLKSSDNKKVCTDSLFSEKPTLLIVYRGGWCPYCNAQLNRIRSIEKELLDAGYQIVAVSPDSQKNVSAEQSKNDYNYTLLADTELNLSKALGLAYFLDDDTAKKYKNKLGVEFVDVNNTSRVALPVPAIFVIDKNAMVHFQYANPNFRVRVNEEIIRVAALESLKSMK